MQSDLRRSRVVLTAEGARLIAAHAPQSERIYSMIEQRFGAERLQQLQRLLSELETVVAAMPAEAVRAATYGPARRSDGARERA